MPNSSTIFRSLALSGLFALLPSLTSAKPKSVSKHAPLKSATTRQSENPPPSAHSLILDTLRIRKLYMDGEFETAIAILETGLKEMRPFDHKDSVFIFKHLGVMYAANYESRERGKMYMQQLLMTEPTARIMDMYASDMIYMIFKNIQDEFETKRGHLAHAKELVAGNQQTEPEGDSEQSPKLPMESKSRERKDHTLVWFVATGAVVATGVVAYFLLAPENTKIEKRSHTVDGF